MNEERIAREMCRHLDRGADQLSLRVQQRLAAARQAALDGKAPAHLSRSRNLLTTTGDQPESLWWRLGATAVPVLLLVIGIFVGDSIQQEKAFEDLAAINSALVTDDVPLVAYADQGFGVYLTNTRR